MCREWDECVRMRHSFHASISAKNRNWSRVVCEPGNGICFASADAVAIYTSEEIVRHHHHRHAFPLFLLEAANRGATAAEAVRDGAADPRTAAVWAPVREWH